MKPIVPALCRLVYGDGIKHEIDVEAERELRALLAVARAAKALHFFQGECEGELAVCVTGSGPLDRALSRLERKRAK